MNIKIDNREGQRIEHMKTHYNKNKITVTQLETGDFIFNDKIAFEYKTLPDFISSIHDGRLIEQAIRLNQTYPYPFIIIQAGEKELQAELNKNYFLRRTRKKNKPPAFTTKQYYGMINRLNCYVTVITCPTEAQCFESMINQAEKCLDDAPVNRKIVKTGNPAYQCLRYCIRGVGEKTARKITTGLELETIQDLTQITIEDLASIHGVSRSKAEKIYGQIMQT